jgi:biopolymer transport protein ExbD
MKFTRTTRLLTGRPDAAPYLCVLFPVALVALFHQFLVLPRGLRIDLPEASSPTAVSAGERALVVGLDSNEQLYFENQRVEWSELKDLLSARTRADRGPRTLLLQADRDVRTARLTELSGIARQAGIRDVVFLTRPVAQ